MDTDFSCLCNKEIIVILDGDKAFESLEINKKVIELRMPYLGGHVIRELIQKFGNFDDYSFANKELSLSRWQIFEILIKSSIKAGKTSALLDYLFSLINLQDIFKDFKQSEIQEFYPKFVSEIIDHINGILMLYNKNLRKEGANYFIISLDDPISLKDENLTIDVIDYQYINDLFQRARQDILDKHYESAITKARTILEESFSYVIQQKGEKPNSSGDIKTLYKQVKSLYEMHGDKIADKRINELFSGLEKIVSAISEIRNNYSDSHGVGLKRVQMEDYHAKLCLDAAVTMADFIISIYYRNGTWDPQLR